MTERARQRWFIAGASGFVGTAVVRSATAHSVEVATAPIRSLSDRELEAEIGTCDVVVNAAGLAAPDLDDDAALRRANVDLVERLAGAAARAGVERFVHVSSASVQGPRRTLDESMELAPFSAYTRTKAEAERGLLGGSWEVPNTVIVYRPASILGFGRSMTSSLVRTYGRRFAPLFGNGEQPLPIATVDRVGEAVVHLGHHAATTAVALHPWEGVTQRLLAESLCAERTSLVSVPIPARKHIRPARSIVPDRLRPAARRVDLLFYGQSQTADVLTSLGFTADHSVGSRLREIAETERSAHVR